MKLRLILSILFFGIVLGYAARFIKTIIEPEPKPFDSASQLLDEN